ncbi:hypothetical protein UlMin_008111 [Ulmus minor]
MVGMREELMKKAYSEAMKAHKSEKFRLEKSSKDVVIFSFPGSWSVQDWYSKGPFGDTEINQEFFPSLRSIGKDEFATVNEAFQERFQSIKDNNPQFEKEVLKAVNKKQVIFTGHSSGGAIAMLATIWLLEKCRKENYPFRPYCVTFGSPLVGNFIFSHALRRENWSNQFIHFVMRYDIVPRVLLAPFSPDPQQKFKQVLDSFKQQSKKGQANTVEEAQSFFKEVMINALKTTSNVASKLKESTNPLLETLEGFIEFSPYRPFGTYIFCNGAGKIVTLKNPDAVLQFLFYSSQLSSDGDDEAFRRSLSDHFDYAKSLNQQAVVSLDSLEELHRVNMINQAFDEFGVDVKGRLCLLAAEESEKRKERNKNKIDSKKEDMKNALAEIEKYRKMWEGHKVGYYDAFKLQKKQEDFKANVKRLELAGIWDEIVEMLKKYELPDNFEGIEEWVELGTRFRRLVEPLDIANFYRHQKNDDSGAYMGDRGRPKRYRYTQRWREHEKGMKKESSGESCFWAEVEELLATGITPETRERTKKLVEQVEQWEKKKEIESDVFLSETTFVKWWNGLPNELKRELKSDHIDKIVSGSSSSPGITMSG